MKERRMTRKQIEEAIKDVVEYREPFFIGTQGINVLKGEIITKIDVAIMEMGLSEKAETWFNTEGEWFIRRKRH